MAAPDSDSSQVGKNLDLLELVCKMIDESFNEIVKSHGAEVHLPGVWRWSGTARRSKVWVAKIFELPQGFNHLVLVAVDADRHKRRQVGT